MVHSEALTYFPVTPERWPDMQRLFGSRGATGGCWCMWWRVKRKDFEAKKGEGNRQAMGALIASGVIPGILAYLGDDPVGWCSIGPRESFPALERSRTLMRIDDQPVWSVVCFFMAKEHRRKGLMVSLLRAAVEYARESGARILEGYPYDPQSGSSPDPFVYTGLSSAFHQAGFITVARPTDTRSIVRCMLVD